MDILQEPEFKKEPLDTQKDEKNKAKQTYKFIVAKTWPGVMTCL